MTKQEILNKVWDYFITQKNPQSLNTEADSTSPNCMYRTPTGNRCAVGVLIPDENYHPELEQLGGVGCIIMKIREHNKTADFGTPIYYEAVERLGDALRADLLEHESFLISLQSAHDTTPLPNETFEDMLRARLVKIANVYELEVPQ